MRVSRFRRSAARGVGRNLAKTLVQIVVLWTTFLWVVPFAISRSEARLGIEWLRFPPLPPLGAVLFALFSLGGLSSAFVLVRHGEGTPLPIDTTGRLVVTGPYAYVRNPMAITGIGQGLSVGLVLGSGGVLLYAVAGALLWNFLARPLEEADLARFFGEPYQAYRRAVPCWIPRLRPYRLRQPASGLGPAPGTHSGGG